MGRYESDPRSRDGAYRQGTVWPWLMGPFIIAYVKTFGKKAGEDFADEWLSQFQGQGWLGVTTAARGNARSISRVDCLDALVDFLEVNRAGGTFKSLSLFRPLIPTDETISTLRTGLVVL